MLRLATFTGLVLAASGALAEARPCRSGETPHVSAARAAGCRSGEAPKPYDPEAKRAGRQPGFVDLGNGTEVRIGGRVQLDYDTRRR